MNFQLHAQAQRRANEIHDEVLAAGYPVEVASDAYTEAYQGVAWLGEHPDGVSLRWPTCLPTEAH